MSLRFVLTVTALAGAAACGEDPFLVFWQENPQEATIYSLDRDELYRPSAFDMSGRLPVVVENPLTSRQWDFALDRVDGELVLVLPRTLGITSGAGIAPIEGVEFEDVREAPEDTLLYSTVEPLSIRLGTIYVVRTRQQSGSFGSVCQHYGKMEPLEVNEEAGVLRFLHDTSPDCNNRSLVPPPE